MIGYPAQQRRRTLRGKWLVFGLFFLFSLIFLVSGSVPALSNLPGLQTRFTGVETTALVSVYADCNGEDGGSIYEYTFTDTHGETRHSINTSVCSNGIVSNGEHVTLWYQPSNPAQCITANDLTFDTIFFVGFSLPMLLFLAVVILSLLRLLFRRWA